MPEERSIFSSMIAVTKRVHGINAYARSIHLLKSEYPKRFFSLSSKHGEIPIFSKLSFLIKLLTSVNNDDQIHQPPHIPYPKHLYECNNSSKTKNNNSYGCSEP